MISAYLRSKASTNASVLQAEHEMLDNPIHQNGSVYQSLLMLHYITLVRNTLHG